MPCKKIQQPPSVCTPASRRLLETVAIKDLSQNNCYCIPNSNEDSGPGPSECGPCVCDEDDCVPGRCCAMDRQCETNTRPEQNQATETCLPSCKSLEVEAMLDEMKRSQQIIRKLALEAMEILHSEQDCPMCKRDAQSLKGLNAKEPYCEHCKNSDLFEPTNQSRTKFLGTPGTPLQCHAHSRTSSVPIARTAFQIKDGRLPKTKNIEDSVKKKKSKADIDIKENVKKKAEVDIPETNAKPSICSCNGEKNLDVNCTCKGKIDCRCGSKSYLQKIFGKKPSICSCNEDPIGQYEEDEGKLSKTGKKKIFKKKIDCFCPPNDNDKKEDGKIATRKSRDVSQVEQRRSSVAASVSLPKCDKDICQCHYPPSYNQYFTCTGQVTGNCSCDKNV